MIFVEKFPVEIKKFSDGAIQVSITDDIKNHLDDVIIESPDKSWEIAAHIKSNDDLIALVQTVAILRQNYSDLLLDLDLPYVPYSRSDRSMDEYSCGGLKAIAPIINSLNFESVYISDPHSDVSEALLNNVVIHDQAECLDSFAETHPEVLNIDFIISPDSGALKKALKSANLLKIPLIEAVKVRELGTNKILRTSVYHNGAELVGKRVLILDDICEGGRTFMALAKVLKEEFQVKEVSLYITHGLFTYGWEQLQQHIDKVYCSYSWLPVEEVVKSGGYLTPEEYY